MAKAFILTENNLPLIVNFFVYFVYFFYFVLSKFAALAIICARYFFQPRIISICMQH